MNQSEIYNNKTNIVIPKETYDFNTPYTNLYDICKNNKDNKNYYVAIGYIHGISIDNNHRIKIKHCYIIDDNMKVKLDIRIKNSKLKNIEFRIGHETICKMTFAQYLRLANGMTENEINKAVDLLILKKSKEKNTNEIIISSSNIYNFLNELICI